MSITDPARQIRKAICCSRPCMGKRVAFNDRNLAKLFVTHPLMTLKVIGAIHWEALRLWWKGARYPSRPEPPPEG